MKLVFVSAGLKAPKKGNLAIYRRQRYLNYGLLSLAGAAAVDSHSVFHGNFDAPLHTLEAIRSKYAESQKLGFLLSCPSFLSLEWAREFICLASEIFPSAKFVLGGRWVVDGNSRVLKSLIPQLSAIYEGVGEPNIAAFVSSQFGVNIEPYETARSTFEMHSLSYLDYTKLNDAAGFVPSFEGSRGCGAGCNFCAEALVKLTKLKPASVLCAEIAAYLKAVPNSVQRFYLEASNFTPQVAWIDGFRIEREKYGQQDIHWRTEGRVDMFSEKAIKALSVAGLKVLDVGLESASPKQLKAMQKSGNPDTYIERSTKLVKMAADSGILVKVNILLYPGEDDRTIDTTREWLTANRAHIAGVSVYPTVYYGFRPEMDSLLSGYRALGASIAENNSDALGIHNLNLSSALSHERALETSRRISQEFMTAEQYFSLKSFSYFDPRYSREDFYADIANADSAMLPFRVEAGRPNFA